MQSFTKLSRIFFRYPLQCHQSTFKIIWFENFKSLKYCSSVATPKILTDSKATDLSEHHVHADGTRQSRVAISEDEDFSSSRESTDESLPVVEKLRNPFWNIENDINNQDSEVADFIDDLAPPLPTAFNLAAYANRSPTLQKFIELNVDLSKIEKKPEYAKFIMQLDFETDIKPYIQFLHDKGVPADELGTIITKNPLIFKHDLDDLQVRINYFESKSFAPTAIAHIITKNPYILSMSTKSVDRRLGFLQKTFKISGDEMRFLITKCPKLVSHDEVKLMESIFAFKETMGFSNFEMKQLLLMKPKMWLCGRYTLEKRFKLIHLIMGIPHEQILKYPGILLKRHFILEQRHKYLKKLGRAQYDPTKPGYISLIDIVRTTDYAFCTQCAKTSVAEYNEFLKTL